MRTRQGRYQTKQNKYVSLDWDFIDAKQGQIFQFIVKYIVIISAIFWTNIKTNLWNITFYHSVRASITQHTKLGALKHEIKMLAAEFLLWNSGEGCAQSFHPTSAGCQQSLSFLVIRNHICLPLALEFSLSLSKFSSLTKTIVIGSI